MEMGKMEMEDREKQNKALSFLDSDFVERRLTLTIRIEGFEGEKYTVEYWNGQRYEGVFKNNIEVINIKAGYKKAISIKIGKIEISYMLFDGAVVFRVGDGKNISIVV